MVVTLSRLMRSGQMAAKVRSTDRKARVTLPKSFANATVLIEEVSATEVRIRKAKVVPEGATDLLPPPLSDEERDAFLAALENPPPANAALKRAVAKYRRR